MKGNRSHRGIVEPLRNFMRLAKSPTSRQKSPLTIPQDRNQKCACFAPACVDAGWRECNNGWMR